MGTGEVMEGRVFSTFFALLFISWLVAWGLVVGGVGRFDSILHKWSGKLRK
jgi:hypothetical protein